MTGSSFPASAILITTLGDRESITTKRTLTMCWIALFNDHLWLSLEVAIGQGLGSSASNTLIGPIWWLYHYWSVWAEPSSRLDPPPSRFRVLAAFGQRWRLVPHFVVCSNPNEDAVLKTVCIPMENIPRQAGGQGQSSFTWWCPSSTSNWPFSQAIHPVHSNCYMSKIDKDKYRKHVCFTLNFWLGSGYNVKKGHHYACEAWSQSLVCPGCCAFDCIVIWTVIAHAISRG